eukprot:2477779-Pyramimonas_sp.AAC.2
MAKSIRAKKKQEVRGHLWVRLRVSPAEFVHRSFLSTDMMKWFLNRNTIPSRSMMSRRCRRGVLAGFWETFVTRSPKVGAPRTKFRTACLGRA